MSAYFIFPFLPKLIGGFRDDAYYIRRKNGSVEGINCYDVGKDSTNGDVGGETPTDQSSESVLGNFAGIISR